MDSKIEESMNGRSCLLAKKMESERQSNSQLEW